MTVAQLITEVNHAFRGDERAPAQGTEEYNYWVSVAKRKLEELLTDDKQNWPFVEKDSEGVVEVPPLKKATEVIEIPIPAWLTYATAAELAFNDLTYDEKYPDLINKANFYYSQMAQNNSRTRKTTVTRAASGIHGVY